MLLNVGSKIKELNQVNNNFTNYRTYGNVATISGFKRAMAEVSQSQSYKKYGMNNQKEVRPNTISNFNGGNRINLLEFRQALLQAQNM